MTTQLIIQTLIAMCSAALNKPIISSYVILGDLSIGGTMIKVESLADSLQVAVSAGAKKVLISMISAYDLPTVPPE